MNNECSSCQKPFQVTNRDLEFYDSVSPTFDGKKYSIPAPTMCPPCRQQRRLTWRNERNLYHNKCALSGKQMISMYSADKSFIVYEQKEWWSDKWSGLDYGQEFDFSRSFFEQFSELQQKVPRINLCNDSHSLSCDFVNQTTHLKNCYLVFDTDNCEDLYYCHLGKNAKSCVDCLRIFDSERCYECIDCHKCYSLYFSQNCDNCSDSYFLLDCIGCRNCIGSVGLRNAEYYVQNTYVGKEKFAEYLTQFQKQKYSQLQETEHYMRSFQKTAIRKEHSNMQCENSIGNYLRNAKDSHDCFDSSDIQDCYYCANVNNGAKDCYDYEVWGEGAEKIYECITVGENANTVCFSESCWAQVHNLLYCTFCMHSSNLFGCTGLKGNTYCILNKQYSKEEYENLVPKIIEKMKEDGEWGEFFPAVLSPFGYNESAAQEYFPYSKEQALNNGVHWFEEQIKKDQYLGPPYTIADDIADVPDTICKEILLCETTGKPYRLIEKELAFYKEHDLPIPRLCPDARHAKRFSMRNPRRFFKRSCAKCSKEIQTTYAPDRPETVYCEECYLNSIA